MRLTLSNASFLLIALGSASIARANISSQPDLVRAPVDTVFVPEGFDDNDNVEVIVHGDFPNSCYRMGPMQASVDGRAKIINLDVKAYLYHENVCTQMLVPFTASIHVGILSPGTYKIVVTEGPTAKAPSLKVAHTDSPGPDSFLYAPVDHVDFLRQGDAQMIEIAGTYPYTFTGCMRIKEVRTHLTSDNVIVILPIAQFLNDQDCGDDSNHRFLVTQTLDKPLAPGKYLLHSRALQGSSVNQFFEIRD